MMFTVKKNGIEANNIADPTKRGLGILTNLNVKIEERLLTETHNNGRARPITKRKDKKIPYWTSKETIKESGV